MKNGDTSLVSSLKYGLILRWPCCGAGKLFTGFIKVAERCSHCGQELKAQDTGGGPAIFVGLMVGALVVAAALIVEVS